MTREQLVASINEMMRRYIADPSEFEAEFQAVDRFRAEGYDPTYGETVVQYLEHLAAADAPVLAAELQALRAELEAMRAELRQAARISATVGMEHGTALLTAEPVVSLRDRFAGLAMQGDWAAQSNSAGHYETCVADSTLFRRAKLFYRMADAMLAVRDNG